MPARLRGLSSSALNIHDPAAPALYLDEMRRPVLGLIVIAVVLFASGCSRSNPAMDFDKLTEDFLYGSLALSPVSATATGYHVHNGVPLDELVDDYSAGGLDQQRNFYKDFQLRVASLDVTKL